MLYNLALTIEIELSPIFRSLAELTPRLYSYYRYKDIIRAYIQDSYFDY